MESTELEVLVPEKRRQVSGSTGGERGGWKAGESRFKGTIHKKIESTWKARRLS